MNSNWLIHLCFTPVIDNDSKLLTTVTSYNLLSAFVLGGSAQRCGCFKKNALKPLIYILVQGWCWPCLSCQHSLKHRGNKYYVYYGLKFELRVVISCLTSHMALRYNNEMRRRQTCNLPAADYIIMNMRRGIEPYNLQVFLILTPYFYCLDETVKNNERRYSSFHRLCQTLPLLLPLLYLMNSQKNCNLNLIFHRGSK